MKPKKINVQEIIDNSIAISGRKLYLNSEIGFSSRNINYKYRRSSDGKLTSRSFTKESKEIHDIMEANSFKRYSDGVLAAVPDFMAIRSTILSCLPVGRMTLRSIKSFG